MTNRIVPLFAFIIAIVIFFTYIEPTWTGSIAAAKAAIGTDNQTLQIAQNYSTEQDKLNSEKNAIDPANLTRLQAFLPDSADNVGIILDLNALAAHSGIVLSKVDVAANSNGSSNTAAANSGNVVQNSINSVDLSVSAIGTFAALQTFLASIEQSERLLDVQKLSVTGSDTGVYSYDMTLRLYWLQS